MGWTACWPSPCTPWRRRPRKCTAWKQTTAAEKVTAHRSEDRNKSEEAVIDAEEATSKACDPEKVGLVEPKDEINLEEPEIKETKALDDNETEVNIRELKNLWRESLQWENNTILEEM